MRKTLLATTALAFAGAMAAGPALAADMMSVGISGSMEQWFGMSSVDDTANPANEGGVAQQSDSEIHFKGKLESDSGLTFSLKVELEGNSSDSGNHIDESQLTVGGSFGAITLGAEDGASVLTHHGVRDAGIAITCGDIGKWIGGIKGCGPGGFGTAGHGLGDKNNITYFSPRLNGVQFGATYIPDVTREGQTTAPHNNDADAFSIGGNYKGDMGGASVAVSAGYYQRSQTMKSVALMSGSDAAGRMPLTAGMLKDYQDDIKAYEGTRDLMKVGKAKAVDGGDDTPQSLTDGLNAAVNATNAIAAAEDMMASKADAMTVSNFGLQVGFGSFSFDVAYLVRDGGAYKVARMDIPNYDGDAWDHDSDPDTADQAESATNNNPANDMARSVLVKDTSLDVETVSVGVMYSDGPMAVSLVHSMVDGDDGDEQSGTMLSGSYTLAPGVVSKTSLFAAERDNADGSSVEGSGFVTGIVLSF